MVAQSPNKLLASLPPEEYKRLLPELHTLHLRDGDALRHCGETRVYFPGTGLCSVGAVMEDGRHIEIASVGSEGVVGMGALAGCQPLAGGRNDYVQVSDGSVQFILVDVLRREVSRSPVLRIVLDAFSQGFLQTIIRSAACNRLHTVQERCARWLLHADDRLGRQQFELTQPFLASVLGVKRPKLALTMRHLEKLGVLEFDSATVSILNRKGLERCSCYCYRQIKQQLAATLPPEAPGQEEPPRSRRNVVRLVPDAICTRCQSAVGLPHASEHECIRAIDSQLQALVRRAQRLHKQRKELLDQRMNTMRKFIETARARVSRQDLPPVDGADRTQKNNIP